MIDLDALDQALLEQMQSRFPLEARPFAVLGEAVGLDEANVLLRTRRLKEANVIRQIGAIFDTRRLGYQSTLVAFHVEDGSLEDAAAVVSAHPGVSHNYARPHYYNLWFTLAVPPGQTVQEEIRRLAEQADVGEWLDLPALRVFKIRTHFRLGVGETRQAEAVQGADRSEGRELTPGDIPAIRALQQDLSLVPRPFAEAAEGLGLSEAALLDKAQDLKAAGIMRRFGAVLRHRRVGYTANGMACWVVPERRIEEMGRFAAGYAEVSHCYHRPAYPPRWPYTLFTMIHGQTMDEVESIVAQIALKTGIQQKEVLYSTREFKKERIRYFKEEA
ncbi:MAG TPA: Lrp/AsnC family transcriptional regulator [Anaerolineae bacterium]|nr:Lrp/AsnC family transcriptional regulator [Anaerolineae bacterium]